MSHKAIPIVFIHYGVSDYLRYTLTAARKTNPDKQIVLIGDARNRHFTEIGIDHFMFDSFLTHPDFKRFNEVYRINGGEIFRKINLAKGGKDWTRFNFQKWLVLKLWCDQEHKDSVWTFDSDTLIVQDLAPFESHFSSYDYTVINSNNVIQGLLNNVNALNIYWNLCVDMLADHAYQTHLLETEFKQNPSWGFTMMRVFKRLSETSGYTFIQLREPVNDWYFDQCICQTIDEETTNFKLNGYNLKRVYTNDTGAVFNYNKKLNKHIQLFAINLSWVPLFVFKRIWHKVDPDQSRSGDKHIAELSLKPNFWYKVSTFARRATIKLALILRLKKK